MGGLLGKMKALVFFFCTLFFAGFAQDTIDCVSFNIKWLGHYKAKENQVLAEILKDKDLVVVQELVDPPVSGVYPDGQSFVKDDEAAAFVVEMKKVGFSYWLSTSDSGKKGNHKIGSSDEWGIVFYKPTILKADSSRFFGFVDGPLVLHPVFDRVPFVFPFKTVNGNSTFSIVNVHLTQGESSAAEIQRLAQLDFLAQWINRQKEANKDFLIVGDCNIYDSTELVTMKQKGFLSLNKELQATTASIYGTKKKGNPFDHVFYANVSIEDLISKSIVVIDLMKAIQSLNLMNMEGVEPFVGTIFSQRFSDHLPITWQMISGRDSD